MAIITVDQSNIDTEHICCAITEKKGENCVGSKKAWLTERFKDATMLILLLNYCIYLLKIRLVDLIQRVMKPLCRRLWIV